MRQKKKLPKSPNPKTAFCFWCHISVGWQTFPLLRRFRQKWKKKRKKSIGRLWHDIGVFLCVSAPPLRASETVFEGFRPARTRTTVFAVGEKGGKRREQTGSVGEEGPRREPSRPSRTLLAPYFQGPRTGLCGRDRLQSRATRPARVRFRFQKADSRLFALVSASVSGLHILRRRLRGRDGIPRSRISLTPYQSDNTP